MSEINKLTEGSDGKLDKADYDRTVKTLLTGGSDPVISKEPVGAYTTRSPTRRWRSNAYRRIEGEGDGSLPPESRNGPQIKFRVRPGAPHEVRTARIRSGGDLLRSKRDERFGSFLLTHAIQSRLLISSCSPIVTSPHGLSGDGSTYNVDFNLNVDYGSI